MLSPRWHKIIRDLIGNKGRTILVVLAIAVGVFAFGGVFASQELLLVNMNGQYLRVNPSTIFLSLYDGFDQGLVRWVQKQPQIAQVDARIATSVKLVREKEKSIFLLYAYSDFDQIKLDRFHFQSGLFPPQKNQIVLERSGAKLLGLSVGDPLTVETADGKTHILTFVGTVHDLTTIPANMFPLFTGYISTSTLKTLNLPSDLSQLQIVTTDELTTQEQIEKKASVLRDDLETRGYKVYSIDIRLPKKHWAEPVIQGFVTILTAIGVFALLLSGFLVINTISSTLARERRQIGMMKAIGASRKDVLQLYLANVAVFGILALFVALPLGAGLAYLNTNAVIGFLNLDLETFYLPTRILILQAAAALFVPVIAALFPLFRGTKITVREAVSDYQSAPSQKESLVEKFLFSIRNLPRPMLISFRNTFRARSRLLLTLSTLILAGTFFLTILNVRASLFAVTDKILSMFNFDIQVVLDQNYPTSYVLKKVAGTPGVVTVENRLGTGGQLVKSDGTVSSAFSISGLPADSAFISPSLTAGRWLSLTDTNAIVLSSEFTRNEPDIKVGDNITIKIKNEKHEFFVAGIVFSSFGEKTAYVNLDYLIKLLDTPDQTSSLFVRTTKSTGAFQSEVARRIEDKFKNANIGVAQAITQDTIVKSAATRTDFIIIFLLVMSGMIAFVGGLGLTSTMSLNVMERTREIGVMRSLGATNGSIRSIVITEGLLIAFASWLIALPLSLPISFGFSYLLGVALFEFPLDFRFDPLAVLIWFVSIIILALIACFLPAQKAVSMKVRETLAYE